MPLTGTTGGLALGISQFSDNFMRAFLGMKEKERAEKSQALAKKAQALKEDWYTMQTQAAEDARERRQRDMSLQRAATAIPGLEQDIAAGAYEGLPLPDVYKGMAESYPGVEASELESLVNAAAADRKARQAAGLAAAQEQEMERSLTRAKIAELAARARKHGRYPIAGKEQRVPEYEQMLQDAHTITAETWVPIFR
jgi:hypothetical protein